MGADCTWLTYTKCNNSLCLMGAAFRLGLYCVVNSLLPSSASRLPQDLMVADIYRAGQKGVYESAWCG